MAPPTTGPSLSMLWPCPLPLHALCPTHCLLPGALPARLTLTLTLTPTLPQVLYQLFDWAAAPTSRLVLVGIANALDLTERFLPKLAARGASPQVNATG